MSVLSRAARAQIRDHGVTVADYAGQFWQDRQWHGDTCGCPDDRCIGYHHDAADDCGCLPVLLTSTPPAAAD